MRETLFGLTIGWAAGISPGPLNLLVVQSALRSGAAAGAMIAIAPLIIDAPIVALSLLVASTVPAGVLTALSTAGGPRWASPNGDLPESRSSTPLRAQLSGEAWSRICCRRIRGCSG